MNNRAKFLTVSFFVLLALLTSMAYAELIKVVNIDPQSKYSLVLFHLNNGQKVTGSLTIAGGGGNDIDFSVTNSTGNTILNLGRVTEEVQFEFAADQDDTYTLHFDNTFSLESSKTVTLKYKISSPFDPSLLFIIVLIVVIILVSFLIIRKKRKNEITQKGIEMSAPKV